MGQLAISAPYPPPSAVVIGGSEAGAAGASASTIVTRSVVAGVPTSPARPGSAVDAAIVQVMVASAVRPVLDHPQPNVGEGGDDWGGDEDGDAAGAVAASIDVTVIAVHDQRIALLRDRLTTLCAADSASPLLVGLRERLRRAEAARGIAIARANRRTTADFRSTSDGVVGDAGVQSLLASTRVGQSIRQARRPLSPIVHRPLAAAGRGHRRAPAASVSIRVRYAALVRSAPDAHRTGGTAGFRFASLARYRHAMTVHRASMTWKLAAVRPHDRVIGHARADSAAAVRLAKARRSLAAARQALGVAAVPAQRTAPVLAGLWRWDGGESWHLTPDARIAG